jgi:hypothetical protein
MTTNQPPANVTRLQALLREKLGLDKNEPVQAPKIERKAVELPAVFLRATHAFAYATGKPHDEVCVSLLNQFAASVLQAVDAMHAARRADEEMAKLADVRNAAERAAILHVESLLGKAI